MFIMRGSDKEFSLVKERLSKYGSFKCGKILPNVSRCTGDYSSYLCGTTVQYCFLTKMMMYPQGDSPDPTMDPVVLHPIQEIEVQGVPRTLFHDPGSTANLCMYD